MTLPTLTETQQIKPHQIIMKTGKKISLQLFFLLFLIGIGLITHPEQVSAQSQKEDVIYLKDGGILRGEIIEIENNKTIKIETAGRNIFVVQMSEVERITEEEVPVNRYYKVSGYIITSGFELFAGADETTPYFYTMNGYQFNPRIAAGVGVGYIPYRHPLDLLPVYLHFNVNMMEANSAPFLFLRAGYNFSIASENIHLIEDHSGGWMINPGMGVQFNLRSGFRWQISVGYSVNNASFEEEEFNDTTIENDLSYRRVVFGIGFSF